MDQKVFNMDVAKKTASFLLESEAVQISPKEPFTWSSGWKSPIYCDNRLTLSYPSIRDFIKESLGQLIQEKYPQADAIAGVATAGIPQGAMVADLLGVPFMYVRSNPKGHGMGNQIEGKIINGLKVVVIEDLISTGKSSLSASQALQEAGLQVEGMAAVFSYGFDLAGENFEQAQVDLYYLSDYSTLIKEALEKGLVTSDEMVLLEKWREDPSNWS